MAHHDLPALAEVRVLYLSTLGQRSGLQRTIEIWFVYHDGKLYLNAEKGRGAQWVRNILQQPRVHIRLAEVEFEAHARVLEQHDDSALWQVVAALSRRKYGWGEGLPVEITPLQDHA